MPVFEFTDDEVDMLLIGHTAGTFDDPVDAEKQIIIARKLMGDNPSEKHLAMLGRLALRGQVYRDMINAASALGR